MQQEDRKKDFKLIRRAAKGDVAAFDELIEDHRSRIKSSIFCFGATEEQYEEIYQKALIKIWNNVRKFRYECSFQTWCYRICLNLYIDTKRKETRNRCTSIETLKNDDGDGNDMLEKYFLDTDTTYQDHNRAPDEKLNLKNVEDITDEVLKKLSTKHRQVLQLFVKEDMTYKQIAKKMNCSIGTVMSRLYYARENFKKALTHSIYGRDV